MRQRIAERMATEALLSYQAQAAIHAQDYYPKFDAALERLRNGQ